MKQKETTAFSWTGLFSVTSFCFFAFSGITRILNGSMEHSTLFFKIGVASFVFYSVAYAARINVKPQPKKKSRHTKAYVNRVNY